MATKELKPITPPWEKGGKPAAKPESRMPPMPGRPSAHAGRERQNITPVILNPEVSVRITEMDSAEMPVDVRGGFLGMERDEFRKFLKAAQCQDRKGFNTERFSNSITVAHAQNETDHMGRPLNVRFMFIRTDDGQEWRIYDPQGNASSTQKYNKCAYVCTLQAGWEMCFLYRETPPQE